MNAKLWSAVTCHRFRRLDDLSSKQNRVQRFANSPRAPALDGDKSPPESAVKSAHSKACGVIVRVHSR
jgi:hypothetical protein